ncbi:GntR family transcriptional regulator [Sporosalibacterium faouarense]|uniref:GntR family transcriptional regulator n=1 Tax=Sporosalibacterium faouarense TaxID=516123 RepID=UPI00192CAC62|nr:GntR family transcriptional regulator [Sporosalibacterium faouarense]
MKKINKQSPLPRYYQLKEIIRDMIENEVLKPGDLVPTERELCKYHEISRMTARKAITELVHEGMLFREQGKGTFVAKPKVKQNVSELIGFTEEMEKRGLRVETKLLNFSIKQATKKLINQLQIESSDRVFEIFRLRVVEGEPYALEKAWIPEKYAKGFSEDELRGNSLYHVLEEKYGLELSHGKQTLEPIILTAYESNLLGVPEDMLGLLFERRAFTNDNTPIEFTKSVYRSDRYKFEITLNRL